MKMNTYLITTGFDSYYCTAWTMAQALEMFVKKDNLMSEVCEGEKEKFKIEAIKTPYFLVALIEAEAAAILPLNFNNKVLDDDTEIIDVSA